MKQPGKKTIGVLLAAALFTAAGCMLTDARFRGGAIQDIPRRIKEAVETANQQSKLEAITQMSQIREQIRQPMEEIAFIQAGVNTVLRGFDVLKSDYKGLLSFDAGERKEVADKLDRLYRIEFELNQYGNTPDAWEAHYEKMSDMQEQQHKQAADVTSQSMELLTTVDDQRAQIMADASAGVISEKQKKALLQALDASVLTARNQVKAQELSIAVASDIADKAERDISQAQAMANPIGSGGTISSDAYAERINEDRLTTLPR